MAAHQTILRDIEAKKFKPIYFLYGAEPYYIDKIVDHIENNVLPEGERSFNQVVLYGKETEFKTVIDNARQFPMMSSHRVVIVREAQAMRDFDMLASYFQKPSTQTLLVLAYKKEKFDKRKKTVWAALKDNAEIFESRPIYDDKLPRWIEGYAGARKLNLSSEAAHIISEYIGNNLSRVANEIDKLAINIPKGGKATKKEVYEFIGINNEYNVFKLQDAIGQKDKMLAYRILRYFAQNNKANPAPLVVGSLYSYFVRLFIAKTHEKQSTQVLQKKLGLHSFIAEKLRKSARNFQSYQIVNAFHHLHDLDRKTKGVGSRRKDDFGYYQEFIYNIFN